MSVRAEGSTTTKDAKVVVLGGTGRVGGATAAALLGQDAGLTTRDVTLAGRRKEGAMEAKSRHPAMANAAFVEVDVKPWCKDGRVIVDRVGQGPVSLQQ